jgi:DNA-directed RNA polymerase specialized sigma subunit
MMDHEERRATILHLRDVEGLSFKVIGQRLGISYQSASQIYRRFAQQKALRKPRRKPTKYQ